MSLEARVVAVAAYDALTATFPAFLSRLLFSLARPSTSVRVRLRPPIVIRTVPAAGAPDAVVTRTRTTARRPARTLVGAVRVVVVAAGAGGGGAGAVTVTGRVGDSEVRKPVWAGVNTAR